MCFLKWKKTMQSIILIYNESERQDVARAIDELKNQDKFVTVIGDDPNPPQPKKARKSRKLSDTFTLQLPLDEPDQPEPTKTEAPTPVSDPEPVVVEKRPWWKFGLFK